MKKIKLNKKGESGPKVKMYLERSHIPGIAFHMMLEEKNGNTWFLLEIRKDGRFVRVGYVPKSVGIPVDSQGRIKFVKEL